MSLPAKECVLLRCCCGLAAVSVLLTATVVNGIPSLLSFSLSLTPPEKLTLYFNAPLSTASCDVTKLTLQNSSNLIIAGSYSPLSGNCSFSNNSVFDISVSLSKQDWGTVQANIHLATTPGNTHISLETSFLTNETNSPLPSSSALAVPPSQYTPNALPPSAELATLDLNTGTLALQISEGSTYNSSVGDVEISDVMGIVTSSILNDVLTPDNVRFFIALPTPVLNMLKLTSLPLSLSLPPALFIDSNGDVSPAHYSLPIAVTTDSTPPQVTLFTFDLDSGVLSLTVSEPVAAGSVRPSAMAITSELEGMKGGLGLEGAYMLDFANLNTELKVSIATVTLNWIKVDANLCTVASNCLLRINATALSDTSSNPLLPPSPLLPHLFIADTSRPFLLSFSLDLDAGLVALTFSEPVAAPLVDPFGISLLNGESMDGGGGSGDGVMVPLSVTLDGASVVATANQSTELLLNLPSNALDFIKTIAASGYAITGAVEDFAATDTAGNLVLPVLPPSSVLPTFLTHDTTSPTLLEFSASAPSLHRLTFTFDEIVAVATWNVSALTLSLLTAGGQSEYLFTGGGVESVDSNVVTYIISESDFTGSLVQEYTDAYEHGSFGVTTRGILIQDIFGNLLLPVEQPIQFNSSAALGNPELISVDFDLDSGRLYLNFSSPVTVTYLAGQVRFQNHPIHPTHTLTLTTNGSHTPQGSAAITISVALGNDDLIALKLNPHLATSTNDTFIVLSRTFAVSTNSIPLAVQNGTGAAVLTMDTQGPEVTAFHLDLDSNILTLQFNEPIPVDTFNESAITLTNSSSLSPGGAMVRLMSTYPLAQGKVTQLRALLVISDSHEVKSRLLCNYVQNCYVLFDIAMATDIAGNPSLPSPAPSRVDSLSLDATPPQFLRFPEFDLDSGHFSLLFSEPVDGSSTDFTQVQFASSSSSSSSSSVTLTEGYTTPNHVEVDFHFSRSDLNAIKLHLDLCTHRDNCWVRLPSFFVSDPAMNPFIHPGYLMGSEASFHQPDTFTADTTAPEVVSVSLDLDEGLFTLFFTEVVVEATFSPDDVTLYSSPTTSLTLSQFSAYSRSSTGAELVVHLTSAELNLLKLSSPLSFHSTLSLSLSTSLQDVAGNRFSNISGDNAALVDSITPDSTRPTLKAFHLFNMENGSLSIEFDEPIDVFSLDVTQLSLLNTPSDNAIVIYTLTGGGVSGADGHLLRANVMLSRSDRVQLKLLPASALGEGSAYITLTSTAVRDTSGNLNEGLSPDSAIPLSVGGYVPDTSSARLTGFSLDLNSSILVLTFDDVVAVSSINATALTIQSAQHSSPPSHITLTTHTVAEGGDSDRVTILVSQDDRFALQFNLNLATSASNTYISTTSSLGRDIEGRSVIAIPPYNALQLTGTFTADTTPPSLSSSSLDMDSGWLSLFLSEPAIPSSLDPSQLSLQSNTVAGGASFSLSPTTSLPSLPPSPSLSLQFEITHSDLNALKAISGLATQSSDTFIVITSRLLTDTNSNPIVAVTADAAVGVSDFTADTTVPELRGFSVDLTPASKLFLTFSETIFLRSNSSLQERIKLLNSASLPTVTVALTSSDVAVRTEFDTVEIVLSPASYTRLLVDDIAANVRQLYLVLDEGGVVDAVGNEAAPTSSALGVGELYISCFGNTYSNASDGTCHQCPTECSGGCSGSDPTIGEGGCASCAVVLLDREGGLLTCTDPSRTSCPQGYFSTSLSSLPSPSPSPSLSPLTRLCQPCHLLCATCSGPNSTDCQTCLSAFLLPRNGSLGIVECLETCDASDGGDCITCHSQCVGCVGSSASECVSCREEELKEEEGEGERDGVVCVPYCSRDEFLSRTDGQFACVGCAVECIGCTGPTDSECVSCHHSNFTTNGSSICVESCPDDYYNFDGTCLHCHDYCDGCTGPSNRNCTECDGDEVEVEGGGVECVPSCPLGQEFDSKEERCQLTRPYLYVSIAGGGAGLLIVLLGATLLLVCSWYQRRKKQKKKGVLFIRANLNTRTNSHELSSFEKSSHH